MSLSETLITSTARHDIIYNASLSLSLSAQMHVSRFDNKYEKFASIVKELHSNLRVSRCVTSGRKRERESERG